MEPAYDLIRQAPVLSTFFWILSIQLICGAVRSESRGTGARPRPRRLAFRTQCVNDLLLAGIGRIGVGRFAMRGMFCGLIIVPAVMALAAAPAMAAEVFRLSDALALAYSTNPELEAQRAKVR